MSTVKLDNKIGLAVDEGFCLRKSVYFKTHFQRGEYLLKDLEKNLLLGLMVL